jgi:2-keto-4-pentenoate hydratase/2-oxohepta-3-ene-1,7-dioic acid hydratase in catechol pathway
MFFLNPYFVHTSIYSLRGDETMAIVNVKMSGVFKTLDLEAQVLYENIMKQKIRTDPPITGTVYGTLLNYKGELDALGNTLNEPPYNKPPLQPILYIKPANTLIGTNVPIPLPSDTQQLLIGASLGVIKQNSY